MTDFIAGYGDAEILAMLKKEALAGQVVDYPSIYKYVKSLTRTILNPNTKAQVYEILRVYLKKLALAGLIEDYPTLFKKLQTIISKLAIPI